LITACFVGLYAWLLVVFDVFIFLYAQSA
jgi:hypothetical protein